MTDKPAPNKAFDFGAANLTKIADEPQEMELRHFETDAPLGVFFQVRGFEGETFREGARKEGNAARKREFEAQRKGKGAVARMLEDDEAVAIRLTLSVLAGWRTGDKPVIINGGDELAFTPANAEWFLREFSWARLQIDEFAGEVKNFTKG
jgi:hypothetical protein